MINDQEVTAVEKKVGAVLGTAKWVLVLNSSILFLLGLVSKSNAVIGFVFQKDCNDLDLDRV